MDRCGGVPGSSSPSPVLVMFSEVWSFIPATRDRVEDVALGMASEARRIADLTGALACGIVTIDLQPEDPTARDLARHGLAKVYLAGQEPPEGGGIEWAARQVASLMRKHGPDLILFPATTVGAEMGARVAAHVRGGLISSCVDFEWDGGTLTARSRISGGKAHLTATWAEGVPRIATVDLPSLEAIAREETAGELELVCAVDMGELPKARRVRRWRLPPDEIDLTEADFVIGVGRPIDRERDLPRIQQLADRLGATVGGSRVAVFQGTVPRSKQIGSSGKWIKPRVYIMLGISGASYHLMGIKGAKHIIAVNVDPRAPIFKHAELAVQGDFADVVTALLEAATARGAGEVSS